MAWPARATPCKASFHQFVLGYSQALNCRAIHVQGLRYLFIEAHPTDEVIHSNINGKIRVQVEPELLPFFLNN